MTTEEENRRNGYEFEKYVADLFPKSKFDIIKTPTRYEDAMDEEPERNREPDLCVRIKNTQFKIWVECKYKNAFVQVGQYKNINLCPDDVLARYKEFAEKVPEPVYIAIGVGGSPDCPEKLYFIPIKDIEDGIIYKKFYDEYERPTDAIVKVEYSIK